MCTTNIYTYVRPDGRKDQYQSPTLCSASRHNQPCANNVLFHHQEQLAPYGAEHLHPSQMPPTPTYTPRSSTPVVYRSGDESDRSYHSASSASRNKRPSGVYVNGQKVLDLNSRRHSSSRRERIVLVDSPPTPRTPPQMFNTPHTAPSSPNIAAPQPYIVDAAPSRHQRRASVSHHASSSRRPIIVDERPRVQIEVVDTGKRHSRHSSRDHSSSSSALEDEERRRRHRRRQEREEERQREEQEIREQRIRARIARANAEIANRQPVPMPPAPPKRSTTTYVRPAVEVPYESELVDSVRQMNLRDEARRTASRTAAEREEDEAQRLRLMERMMPRRRATVGPGSRRHRVLYDDGVYRWE